MSTQLCAGLSVVFFSIWYAQSRAKKQPQPPYPPGPPPHFLLGNVPDFPYEKPWLVFNEWKEKYGDIIYLNLMGQRMVILNSREACIDLLEKRSAIYSDRPHSVMLHEIMGWSWALAMIPYSHRWRAHRRMFHQYMNEHAVQEYHSAQERHAHAFLRNLLETPEKFLDHARLLFAASIMDVVYGIKVEGMDNIYVQTAEAAIHGVSIAGSPGRFMVDTLPWLKYVPAWFPGAGFQRRGKEWKTLATNMNMLPYEHVKRNMAAGQAGPSIMGSMLSRIDEEKPVIEGSVTVNDSPEGIARNAAGSSYAAGVDTSLSSVQSVFLAMAKWPEVQKAAQAEIDAIVGNSRLPTFEDRDNLPYIQALVKEALRWHNTLPIGLPHINTVDDEYKGYFIPKGTIVIPNAWTILHDPYVYPDPEVFNPERFLINTPQGRKINPDVPDVDPAFGFGRRVCPGRHFADNSLFVVVSNVLAAFNISAPTDTYGKPTQLIAETTGDALSQIPCAIQSYDHTAESSSSSVGARIRIFVDDRPETIGPHDRDVPYYLYQ